MTPDSMLLGNLRISSAHFAYPVPYACTVVVLEMWPIHLRSKTIPLSAMHITSSPLAMTNSIKINEDSLVGSAHYTLPLEDDQFD